ncbi:TPA: phosphoglucosamine mutase [archaeon]|uniref:Phosphoglucosamine mutase n=1 Tax=Candidatus Naiadarchaeum limnaeum TaxID=2756139 RepID=A0A832V214_9ARCH|nr:phosphoglucosamine mutase [Candidatus Naiadarchaeum limnaeum]
MALFSTTGIRGISNETLTSEFVLDLARTYGSMLKQGSKVLIGNDPRTSSEMVKSAVIAGLLETGLNGFDTGIVPIPVLNFAVKQSYDAGIMVTSSHNPAEYNGLKFILTNGMEISENQEKRFEQIYKRKNFRRANWKKIGKYTEHNVIQDYETAVLNFIKLKALNLKIVLDIGNGAQGTVVPNLFKQLSCETVILHRTMNGFFERGPEPRPDTLTKLRETVLSEQADMGIAFDTDGDRAIFVTGREEILMGDVTGSLLANEILSENKGGLIVTTVATSSLIDYVVEKNNGKIIKTKIGGKIVGDVIIKKKALFGFEENGGCMFPQISPSRDGALTAVKIAELVASSGKSLSQLVAKFPKFHQLKARIHCEEKLKSKVMTYIKTLVKKEVKKIDSTDGVKIFFEDDSWILIRPSGTEPIFRVFCESKSQKRTEELEKWGVEKVKEAIKKL